MYIAFISSEENISNLEALKEINRELALNPEIPEGGTGGDDQDGKGLCPGHAFHALHRGGSIPVGSPDGL